MKYERGISLDYDGLMGFRVPFQLSATVEYLRKGNEIYAPPSEIPQYDRTLQPYKKIGFGETVDILWHAWRRIFPDVIRTLHETYDPNDLYFINTGRKDKFDWRKLTQKHIKRLRGKPEFVSIKQRPEGLSTAETKIAGINEELDNCEYIDHYDDNPRDGLKIAGYFLQRGMGHRVRVTIVEDLSAGILFDKVEMEKYPNVRRAATFREAVYSNIVEDNPSFRWV